MADSYVWRKQESSTFGHSHIQTQLVFEVAQDCACWETGELHQHSTLGKAGQELCTLWIHHYCRSPILASAQASISSQSFTSILSQVWKQHIWTYLFGYQPILTHIHYSSSWVLAPEFTLQKKRGCTMYFTMHHNCANVSKFSVHKFTSFQWGTKGINMIVISSFLWKGHTSSLPFKLDCNFSDFLRW